MFRWSCSIQVAKVLQRVWVQSSSTPSDSSLLQVRLEFAGINAPKSGDCSLVSSVPQYLTWKEECPVGEGDSAWVCGLQLSGSVSNPAVETQLCVTRGKDCIVCPTSGTNKGPLWPCQILPTAKLLLCTEGSGSALWQIAAAVGAAGGRGSSLGPVIPQEQNAFVCLPNSHLSGCLINCAHPPEISAYCMDRKAFSP